MNNSHICPICNFPLPYSKICWLCGYMEVMEIVRAITHPRYRTMNIPLLIDLKLYNIKIKHRGGT